MGVWCSRPEYLDRIGPKLCETGVGFHTHRGSGDIGSIWSAGVGSMGVEFHGSFDGTFFNESDLTPIDYCTSDSTGTCAHHHARGRGGSYVVRHAKVTPMPAPCSAHAARGELSRKAAIAGLVDSRRRATTAQPFPSLGENSRGTPARMHATRSAVGCVG